MLHNFRLENSDYGIAEKALKKPASASIPHGIREEIVNSMICHAWNVDVLVEACRVMLPNSLCYFSHRILRCSKPIPVGAAGQTN